jgi:hypothetical protein
MSLSIETGILLIILVLLLILLGVSKLASMYLTTRKNSWR